MPLRDWVTLIAELSSICGLVVAIGVLFQTRAIKKAFVIRARLPESSARLKEINNKILKDLGRLPGARNDINSAFSQVQAVLLNLKPKLRGEKKLTTKLLEKLKRGERQNDFSNDLAWEFYRDIQGFIVTLEERMKDSKWD